MKEGYAAKFHKLPDRIAAIVGKTFAVRGDAWTLSDDEALCRIVDELNELDERLIEQHSKKRLRRRA